jgi:ABC-2 type transport system permease protein
MTAIPFRSPGFTPFMAKELREWWRRRAALVTFVAVSVLGAIGTLATRFDELAGGVPDAGMLDPTANVLGAQFDQWIVLAAIFGSIGLLTTERASGTLAWTLSKPLSRNALLLSKWLAAVAVMAVAAITLPLLVSVGIATWAYGSVPDLATIATFGLLLAAAAAFIVALNLALATRIDSQAGIAAIAFAVFAAPYLIGSLLPPLAAWWPTAIGAVAGDVAAGAPMDARTVIGWATGILVAGVIGALVLNREDL